MHLKLYKQHTCIIFKPILIFFQLISVLFSCGGIILFAYADGFQPAGALGVILSILSAIGIAMYKVSLPQMLYFLKCIGCIHAISSHTACLQTIGAAEVACR